MVSLGCILDYGEVWMSFIIEAYQVGIQSQTLSPDFNNASGFWGNFWHDLFRFHFLTITRKLIPDSGNDKRSAHSIRGFLYMTTVFALSGSMHAAGSYAELRKTAPLLLFAGFVIQSVGVALQETITMFLVKMRVGPGLKKAVINCYWFGWGITTAPMVIGDMAACGLFQSKVIPFSIIDLFWRSR
jgi:hypothetical protein